MPRARAPAAWCSPRDGPVFSAGYDIGDLPDDEFADEAEELVAHPFDAAIEALEAFPFPPWPRSTATRSAAGSSWRSPATCGSPPPAPSSACRRPSSASSTRTPGCASSSTRSAPPRTRELFLTGRNVDAATRAARGAWSTSVVAGRRARERAVELAAEIAANAPLSLRGNKRVIRELLAAEGALDPEVEARAGRAARGLLPLRGLPRGRARVRREARARWRAQWRRAPRRPRRRADARARARRGAAPLRSRPGARAAAGDRLAAVDAVGLRWAGSCARGVQLPAEGPDFFTWDPVLNRPRTAAGAAGAPTGSCARRPCGDRASTARRPRRPARRDQRPLAPPRRRLRHALRRARPRVAPERARRRRLLPAQGRARARAPTPVAGRPRARAGARGPLRRRGRGKVFVGPHLHLHGPAHVVMPLVHHDDHMHVRLPTPPRERARRGVGDPELTVGIIGMSRIAVSQSLPSCWRSSPRSPRRASRAAEDPGRRSAPAARPRRSTRSPPRRRSTSCATAATPSTPRSPRPPCSASPSRSRAASAAAASWSIYTPRRHRSTTIDGRETAPAAMRDGLVHRPSDRPAARRSTTRASSGLSRRRARHARAPGTTALTRYGTIALAPGARGRRSTSPSDGFVVDQTFFDQTSSERRATTSTTSRRPRRSTSTPDGTPHDVGTVLRNPDLAKTYELIAARGAKRFYRGAIGDGDRRRPSQHPPLGADRQPHRGGPALMTARRPRRATTRSERNADARRLPRPRRLRHGPAVERRLDRRRGAEHPRGLRRLDGRPRRARCTTTSRRRGSPSPTATRYLGDPAYVDVPLRGPAVGRLRGRAALR